MRCPNCAGEVPAGSRFCGICGRNVTAAPEAVAHVLGSASGGGQWHAAAARAEAQPAMSLFELPVSRRARAAKLALVLVLDAILAGAGIVMILSYLDARSGPPAAPAGTRKPPAVKVGAPKTVAPAAPAPAQPPAVRPAPSRQPKAAPIAAAAPTRPAEAPVASDSEAEGEAADDEVAAVSEQMSQLVAARAGDLERCYQRAAKLAGPSDPLEGMLEVHVTVMPDGSAREVRAGENTTGSAQLADCAVSLFQTFAVARGAAAAVELVWPLQFRPPDK
ncbi:MAG TPA: hypothetical protein VFU21_19570 [Kofleriaceae bacterium]|nr:hypothetical protein [Kofleriaceae bacterium]